MRYLVWLADDGEDNAREIKARDEEAAAEEFVELWDAEELTYPIATSGKKYIVCVRSPSGVQLFEARGEFTPTYYIDHVGPQR